MGRAFRARREICRPHGIEELGSLPVPDAASGDGILFVNTVPWADVLVDGVRARGNTPLELRLAAGFHRIRLENPRLGSVEQVVEVRAGAQTRFEPRLPR